MSTDAINFVLDKYSLDSGVFKIYYDFDAYSGGHVLSQPDADPLYSGEIYGDVASFTGSSGSGDFNQGYIKVQHADVDLNSGNSGGATFLFSCKKSNVRPGTIFSNFGKTGDFVNYYTPTSGWEIGFNSANKIYFRNYNELIPTIKTLNSVPLAENIYAVRLDAGNVGMWHYDPVEREFDTLEFHVDENFIRPSYDWYIGTGEYQYQGYIDEFMYLSDPMGDSVLAELCTAIFQDITISPEISGVITGLVTGYEAVPTGETGFIGFTGVLSGTIDITGSGVTPTGTGILGPVEAGDIYYELIESDTGFLGNNYPFYLNLYSGFVATGSSVEITGFSTGTSGFSTTAQREIYTSSGIGGVLATGTGYLPLSGLTHFLATGASTGLVNTTIHKYLPDSVSYIGRRGDAFNIAGTTGDMVEIISGVSPSISNTFSSFGYNSQFNRNTYLVPSGDNPALFLNGIQQFEGTALVTENELYEELFNVLSGDFFQSGAALFQNTFQSNSPSFNTDEVLCDLNQTGLKSRLGITGSGQYEDAPFSQISADSTQVFFNGQKIYSGIDYESVGGLFRPTGEIVSEGMTGFFTTLPLQQGQGSLTGINRYDYNFPFPYSLDSLSFYINGIRQNPDQFVQHSSGVDLIETGLNIMEGTAGTVYYINGHVGLKYSSGDYWDG